MADSPERAATILCVDDLKDNLAIRKMMLETFGYRTLTANEPTEALDLLRTNSVDLVLTDYSFPNSTHDGEWLAIQIRTQFPSIRTVMLSGYPSVPDSVRSVVDAFFSKGSDPSELKKALADLTPGSKKVPNLTDAQARNVRLLEKSRDLAHQARKKRTG